MNNKTFKFIVKPNEKLYEGYCFKATCPFLCVNKCREHCGNYNNGGGGSGGCVHVTPVYGYRGGCDLRSL